MHVIRLRAPWEAEALATPGSVRCTRHFNKPTGLGSSERVWLVIEGPACPMRVTFNSQSIGKASRLSPSVATYSYDITPLLAARNKIEIELQIVEGDDPLASLGEVRLEIEEAAATSSGG